MEEVRFTDRIFTFHGAWFPRLHAFLAKRAIHAARYSMRVRRRIFGGHAARGGKFLTFNPTTLYSIISGDISAPTTLVAQSVRWVTRAVDFAALVTPLGAGTACVVNGSGSRPDSQRYFHAKLFHFGAAPRVMSATLLELRAGRYAWRIVNGTFADRVRGALGPDTAVLANGTFSVVMDRASTNIPLRLPPRTLVELGVFADDAVIT